MKCQYRFLLVILLQGMLLVAVNAQSDTKDSLPFFRADIDRLDAELIKILGQRMQVVAEVGKYKATHNIPALQTGRFNAILQKNIELGKKEDLSEKLITDLMNAIHAESLAKENALIEQPKSTSIKH
jgi:chorismate mutase